MKKKNQIPTVDFWKLMGLRTRINRQIEEGKP